MKPLVYGAVLGLLVVVFGLPLTVPSTILAALVQPLPVAFLLGLAARPHLTRRRWTA